MRILKAWLATMLLADIALATPPTIPPFKTSSAQIDSISNKAGTGAPAFSQGLTSALSNTGKQALITQSAAASGTTAAPLTVQFNNTGSSLAPAAYIESQTDGGEGVLHIRSKQTRSGGSNTLLVDGNGTGGNLVMVRQTVDTTPATVFNVDGNGKTQLGAPGGNQTHSINGNVTVSQVLSFTTVNDSSSNGTVNALPYNGTVTKLTASTTMTLNGIAAAAVEGSLLILINQTGNTITVNDESGSASPANQIVTTGTTGKSIPQGATAWFVYGASRWRMIIGA